MQGMEKTANTKTLFDRPRNNGQHESRLRAAPWLRKAGIWTATLILAVSLNFASGTSSQNKDAGAFFRPKANYAQQVGEFFKPTAAAAAQEENSPRITSDTLEEWLREGGVRQDSHGYRLLNQNDPELTEAQRETVREMTAMGMAPWFCEPFECIVNNVSYSIYLGPSASSEPGATLNVMYGPSNNPSKVLLDLGEYFPGRPMNVNTRSVLSENAEVAVRNTSNGESAFIADEGINYVFSVQLTMENGKIMARPFEREIIENGVSTLVQTGLELPFTLSDNFGLYTVAAKEDPNTLQAESNFGATVVYDPTQYKGAIFASEGGRLVGSISFTASEGTTPRLEDIRVAAVMNGERLIVFDDGTEPGPILLRCNAGQETMEVVPVAGR